MLPLLPVLSQELVVGTMTRCDLSAVCNSHRRMFLPVMFMAVANSKKVYYAKLEYLHSVPKGTPGWVLCVQKTIFVSYYKRRLDQFHHVIEADSNCIQELKASSNQWEHLLNQYISFKFVFILGVFEEQNGWPKQPQLVLLASWASHPLWHLARFTIPMDLWVGVNANANTSKLWPGALKIPFLSFKNIIANI